MINVAGCSAVYWNRADWSTETVHQTPSQWQVWDSFSTLNKTVIPESDIVVKLMLAS